MLKKSSSSGKLLTSLGQRWISLELEWWYLASVEFQRLSTFWCHKLSGRRYQANLRQNEVNHYSPWQGCNLLEARDSIFYVIFFSDITTEVGTQYKWIDDNVLKTMKYYKPPNEKNTSNQGTYGNGQCTIHPFTSRWFMFNVQVKTFTTDKTLINLNAVLSTDFNNWSTSLSI